MKWNFDAVSPRCLATVLQILASAFPLAAGELHVSPKGDDANPGTAAKPMVTLDRAQEVVRKLAGEEAVSVLIHGGTYEIASPLVFGPRDSGTAEHPVTWAATRGARVNPLITP
jgi:hypothetical protein